MPPPDHVNEESAPGPSEDQDMDASTREDYQGDGNPPHPYPPIHPMARSGSSPPRSDPGFSAEAETKRRAPPKWFYDERMKCVLHNRAYKECQICLAFINHIFPAIASQDGDYERAIAIMIKCIEEQLRAKLELCIVDNNHLRDSNDSLERKVSRILDELDDLRARHESAKREILQMRRERDGAESRPHKKPRNASASSSSSTFAPPAPPAPSSSSSTSTHPPIQPEPTPSMAAAPAAVIGDQDVDMNAGAPTTASSPPTFAPTTINAFGVEWIVSPQPCGEGRRYPSVLNKPAYAWDAVWNSVKGVFEMGGKMYLPVLKAGGRPIPKFVMEDDVSQNLLTLGKPIALGGWANRDWSKPPPPRPQQTPAATSSNLHSDLVTPTDSAGIDRLTTIVLSETEAQDRKSRALVVLQDMMREANRKAVKERSPADIHILHVWPSVKPGGKGKGKPTTSTDTKPTRALLVATLGHSPQQPLPYADINAHLAWFTYQFRVLHNFPDQVRTIPRGVSSIHNDAGELVAEPSSARAYVRFSRLNTLGTHGQGSGSVIENARTLFFLLAARVAMIPGYYRERMDKLGININPIRRDVRLVVSPNLELDDVVRLLAECGVTQREIDDSALWGRNWVAGYLAATPDSDPALHVEYQQTANAPRPPPLPERSEVAPTMTLDVLSEYRTAGASTTTIASLRSQAADTTMADTSTTGLDATNASVAEPSGDPLGSDGSSMTPPPTQGESSSSPIEGEMAVDEEAAEVQAEAAKKPGSRTSNRLKKTK